jgi:2-polyprenyl-3-methyl-5-hydroxy-6-metoxy-1,4-benzoquinol methylase
MKMLERAIAAGYGSTYDAVVEGFEPYLSMLAEIEQLIGRSGASSVLDVACGIGNLAEYLARRGYTVRGVDAVAPLIEVAKKKRRGATLRFDHLDVARDVIDGQYDVVVSMNTLYWHPDPEAFLRGCRCAVSNKGHGVFLTYARPASVLPTAQEIRRREGAIAAARSLRWLLPTALFELLRDFTPKYFSEHEFHVLLANTGFEILETRSTFLAGICHLAWARAR